MQVNTDIYTITRYTDGAFYVLDKTQNISPANNFPLGEQINKSVTFSASTANFAPMRHIVLSANGIDAMSFKTTGKTNFTYFRRNAQQVILDGNCVYQAGENFGSLSYAYTMRYEPGRTNAYTINPVAGINYRHLMSSLIVVVAEISLLSSFSGHYWINLVNTNNKTFMTWEQYKTNCVNDMSYPLTHFITSAFLGNVAIYQGNNSQSLYGIAFCDLEKVPMCYYGNSGSTVAVYGEGEYYYYTDIYSGSGYVKNAGNVYTNSGRLHFDHGNFNLPVFNTSLSHNSRCSNDCDMTYTYFANGGTWIFGFDPNDPYTDFIVYSADAAQTGACEYCINNAKIIGSGADFITELQDYLYKRASTYGVPFCISNRDLTSIDYDHLENYPDIIIPQINNGVFEGDYTIGGNTIDDSPAADFYNDQTGSAIFDYGVPEVLPDIDPNTYTDTISLGHPAINATGIFNPVFALNQTEVKNFRDYVYNANDSIWDEILDGLKLMGANPINAVISLRLYPFDISAKMINPQQENIVLGRTELPINGYVINNDTSAVIDLGSCSLFPENKNFLDYSPFTQVSLFVPFIGQFEIDTEIFMGHDINVKMIVDYTTGAAVCVIYCDSIPVIYKQGVIAVEIPITGTNSAQYANSIVNTVLGSVTGAVSGAVSGAAKGGAGGAAIGAASSVIKGAADLASNINDVKLQTAGTSTPQCALYQPLKPYLTIYRSQPDEPRYYANEIGYACNLSGSVGAFSGYIVCANVDTTGLTCTNAERETIYDYLTNGVYI